MVDRIDGILLSSKNSKKLSDFYKNVVGLRVEDEFEMEDGTSAYSMNLPDGPNLFISSHSDIKGNNNEPARLIINFEVGDIEKEVERIGSEAKKIKETYHVEGYGFIVTFEDPDGNYFQLVQVRPTN